MVIQYDVAYVKGIPDNEYVGIVYKNTNDTYQLNITLDVSPMSIYMNYQLPDDTINENPIQVTQTILISDDMSLYAGDLKIVLELRDGDQILFTRPIHLEIRE